MNTIIVTSISGHSRLVVVDKILYVADTSEGKALVTMVDKVEFFIRESVKQVERLIERVSND